MVYLLEARNRPLESWIAVSVFDTEHLAGREAELADFMFSEWRISRFPMNDNILGTRNIIRQWTTEGSVEEFEKDILEEELHI